MDIGSQRGCGLFDSLEIEFSDEFGYRYNGVYLIIFLLQIRGF